MIGVAENNLCVDIIAEFMLMHTFDTAQSADRHKHGSEYLPVVGGYLSGAGCRTGSCSLQIKFHDAKLRISADSESKNVRYLPH